MNSHINSLENILSKMENNTNEQPPKAKDVMTPLEAAKYLNIDVSKVFDLINSPYPSIPYMFVGGEYRFNKSAIDLWMQTNSGVISN